MARKRASMREGPLAELFRKTEAAQRGQDEGGEAQAEPDPRAEVAFEETVEHVPDFTEGSTAAPARTEPAREPESEAAPEEVAPEAAASGGGGGGGGGGVGRGGGG
jgi:hypothetical protein